MGTNRQSKKARAGSSSGNPRPSSSQYDSDSSSVESSLLQQESEKLLHSQEGEPFEDDDSTSCTQDSNGDKLMTPAPGPPDSATISQITMGSEFQSFQDSTTPATGGTSGGTVASNIRRSKDSPRQATASLQEGQDQEMTAGTTAAAKNGEREKAID